VLRERACEGWVVHRRRGPVAHAFRYPVWMLYADVDRLDALPGRWFSSRRRFAPLSLRAHDLPRDGNDGTDGIRAGVNRRLMREGLPAADRVFVLTQPRSWGWLFNPVTFFFCFREGPDGARLSQVLAEITNTPWGELHTYVLEVRQDADEVTVAFPKRFHVSPFLPMDIDYRWRFRLRDDAVEIAMHLTRDGEEVFFAGLYLRATAATAAALRRGACRYPLQNLRTLARIYWQAARLWHKRAPFHAHPATLREAESS
jgi:uncharacterized protein